jgi:hypothetical protein
MSAAAFIVNLPFAPLPLIAVYSAEAIRDTLKGTHLIRSSLRTVSIGLAIASLAGCAGAYAPVRNVARLETAVQTPALQTPALQTPALIGITQGGVLKYFPIAPNGGSHPRVIAMLPRLSGASNMVADREVVAIADQNRPGVVTYNIRTKALQRMADPYGTPIDIAIDKHRNLFTLDYISDRSGNVTMYPPGAAVPRKIGCSKLGAVESIAVDNEGDIFVNGYTESSAGVVEIPNGPDGPQGKKCRELMLLPETGYVAGVAVDPKTDDLIVLDDPDECAGGVEGRMTIYPKPYSRLTAHSVNLQGHCVGPMRLDATSKILFAFDATISGGRSYILQRSYPSGHVLGSYRRGNIFGITTIPNVLPN